MEVLKIIITFDYQNNILNNYKKKMKSLKITHIDNGGHGYYSVSKELIKELNFQNEISGFSGMDKNRVYLEEDCDANKFFKKLDELGLKYEIKESYNLNFRKSHNYDVKFFDVKIGDELTLHDGTIHKVSNIEGNNLFFGRYKLSFDKISKYFIFEIN